MKAAVLFNTNVVGGAERSLLCQLEMMKEFQIECFIPRGEQGRGELIKDYLQEKYVLHEFEMPRAFQNLSRSGGRSPLALLLGGISLLGDLFSNVAFRFKSFDLIYCNGLKVLVLCLLHSFFMSEKKCIVFHLRDYLSSKGIISFLKIYCKISQHELLFVCNSYSVADSLKLSLPQVESNIRVVYNVASPNQSSEEYVRDIDRPPRTIALASMMAPWKGIHWAITSLALARKELQALGFERVNIYGGEIYQTSGEHDGYLSQCKALVKNHGAESFFSFEGVVPPSRIFKENDVLIHSSISPEPFGRVVLEAFHHRVILISTALGGSGELVIPDQNALKVYPYDTVGLLTLLRKISQGVSFRLNLLNNGYRYSDELHRKSVQQVKDLVSECKKRKTGLVAGRI